MTSLAGTTVLVTGAARGLGHAYVTRLAAEGAAVVMTDLDERELRTAANDIRSAGGRVAASAGSVTDPESLAAAVELAVASFGGLDAVVHNAGFLRDRSFAKMSWDEWHAVLNVHLDAAFLVARASWPHLRSSENGRVVLVTSHSGLWGNFGQANYAAAKLGVVGLANTLAVEGTRDGVLVNTVAPLAATRIGPPATDDLLSKLDPSYAASLVAYLCSPACRTTGALVMAAGGTYRAYAMYEGPPVRFDAPPAPTDLHERWSEIVDLSTAQRSQARSLEELL